MGDDRDPGLSRRDFVGAAAAVPATAWLAGPPAPPAHDAAARSWASVRRLFALDPRRAHLSSFILAPHPAPVRAAIARHRRGLDRDPRTYLSSHQQLEERVARAAAEHLRTSADLVALTDSTTQGLGIVFGGLRLERGDEILTTAHDHFVSRRAAELAAARTGARVREVELYPPGAPEQADAGAMVAAIAGAIGPSTKVVLVTWVHSSSGIRLPLADIAAAVAGRALLVVDAAHALGTARIEIERTGCDVLAASGHKWLTGPRGTGLVWARPAAWERIAPTTASFRPGEAPGAVMTPGGYHSFEHRWALAEAFALHEAIGPARIERRIAALADRLRAGLRAVDGVTLHAPADPRLHSGIVTFSVRGTGAEAVVGRLAQRGVVATVTPYDVRLVRLGTSWMNTEREVDAALRALARAL